MTAKVTVVGTLKGGVGKTKLAMMVALALAARGESVYVIDGDTVSQTAYDWMRDAIRSGVAWPENLVVVRHPFEDIDEHIDSIIDKHDHVIADVGGGNRAVLEAALTRAHRLLVPCGADPSETRRLPATFKSAKNAAPDNVNGSFDAYVVLSKTDHKTSLPRQAREQLSGSFPLCETEMVQRVAYQRAYANVPTDHLDVPALLAEVGLVPAGGE